MLMVHGTDYIKLVFNTLNKNNSTLYANFYNIDRVFTFEKVITEYKVGLTMFLALNK